jgi:hypothetical protein
MIAQVRYLVAAQSGGWVKLSAVYTVHKEMRSVSLLVEPQNQGLRFISSLGSKPMGQFISGLASKPLGRFLPV